MDIKQFLLGSCLGDGSFIKKSENNNTYCVFKHAESQKEYLKWKYELILENKLTDYNHKGIVEVNIKKGSCFPNNQRQFKCSTISSAFLNCFYRPSEDYIISNFGEEAFVIWLLDDGNIYNKRIKISCGSKTKYLCLKLIDYLSKELKLDCYYYEHPTKPIKNYITIRKTSYELVKKIVYKYLPKNIDIIKNKFDFDNENGGNNLVIKIKYHTDIEPLCFIDGVSDWIDLRCANDVHLKAGEFAIISLGVSMKIPEGYEAHLAPRSSTFKKYGLLQTNSVGVIDGSYSGDNDIWGMPVYATRDIDISKNERICQFRIMEKMPYVTFTPVEHLSDINRGGWGSTGSL